jgi:pimeloyl-ACP methyl ester carboxylesterase
MGAATSTTIALDPGWTLVGGTPVFHRSRIVDGSAATVLHVHGFAISGSYMVPTAQLLADEFTTYVPDLPGFGRSPKPDGRLDIPGLADSAAAYLDAVGVERATIVGNSLGTAILASFAERHPDRLERAVMVSPAGGKQSQPLPRALWQLASDAPREPTSMATVAVPDYLHFGVVDTFKLFVSMTRFPAFERLIAMQVPLLAVLGVRDPLLPPAARIREVAQQMDLELLTIAVIKEAAHAINYSHPRELAALIRSFVRDEPMTSSLVPAEPGLSPVAVIQRHP